MNFQDFLGHIDESLKIRLGKDWEENYDYGDQRTIRQEAICTVLSTMLPSIGSAVIHDAFQRFIRNPSGKDEQ